MKIVMTRIGCAGMEIMLLYSTHTLHIFRNNPMECVIRNQPKFKTVKKILSRNNILPTELNPKKASVSKSESDIAKMLKEKHIDDMPVAVRAFAILNEHIHVDLVEIGESNNVELLKTDDFMNLNAQAVSGLHVFDTPNQSMSLFKVLNRTR